MKLKLVVLLTIFFPSNIQSQANQTKKQASQCLNETYKITSPKNNTFKDSFIRGVTPIESSKYAIRIVNRQTNARKLLVFQPDSHQWYDLTPGEASTSYLIGKNGYIFSVNEQKITRYSLNMEIDPTFGENGVVDFAKIDGLSGFWPHLYLMKDDSENNLYIFSGHRDMQTRIVKLSSSGKPDSSFGDGGFISQVALPGSTIYTLDVDNNDQLVTVGIFSRTTINPNQNFYFTKYTKDGKLDKQTTRSDDLRQFYPKGNPWIDYRFNRLLITQENHLITLEKVQIESGWDSDRSEFVIGHYDENLKPIWNLYFSRGEIDKPFKFYGKYLIGYLHLNQGIVLVYDKNILLSNGYSNGNYNFIQIQEDNSVDRKFMVKSPQFSKPIFLINGNNLLIASFDSKHNLILQQICLRSEK